MSTHRGIAVRLFVAVVLSVGSLSFPSMAWAQPAGRFEVGGAIEWFGSSDLGDRSANLTANSPRSADPFVLFTTKGRQDSALGGGVTLAARLSRRFSVEGSFLVARPSLEITIPNDVEPLPDIVVEGRLTEYLFEGSVVADLVSGAKWSTFIMGGAGYLRQLHDQRALVDNGRVYHVGGGVKYRLRSSPARFVKGLGLRAQARLLVRDEGFSLEGQNRPALNVGAGLFAQF